MFIDYHDATCGAWRHTAVAVAVERCACVKTCWATGMCCWW